MTTWVLLRGLTREARHWGDFPVALQAAFPEDDIVAPDLPGNGRLHRQASPMRIEAMVEACRRDLRERDHPPPYAILALSLGGMVGVAWAALHPQEIEALVLINSSLRPFSRASERLRPESCADLLRIAAGRDPRRAEALVLARTSTMHAADPQLIDEWADYRRERPVSRRNALRQLFAAWRFRAPRQRPAVPILVLAGGRDQLVDPACSRALARQWQAPIEEHAEAGHDLPLDDGLWVARRVADWRSRE